MADGPVINLIRPLRLQADLDEIDRHFLYGRLFKKEPRIRQIYLSTKELNKEFTSAIGVYYRGGVYIGADRVLEYEFPFVAATTARKYVVKQEEDLYESYFSSKFALFEPYTEYYSHHVSPDIVGEIAACIVTCKLAKKEKIDYSFYENRAKICMAYLNGVYKSVEITKEQDALKIKRIIFILNREMSRL